METVIDLLKRIVNKTSREHNYSLLLSSNKSDFTTRICPPLELKDNRWAVGLLSLETYNSIPNITDRNNVFTYSTDSGAIWKTIKLATGSYEISQINSEIQRLMALVGDSGIQISINNHTLGSVVNITQDTYQVDFTVANSLASTLGFDSVILTQSYNISPSIVNILSVNSILVNCSVVKNSYLNSNHHPTLYSFFPNVKPGYKVVQDPVNVVYLPLNGEQIQDIRIWLTDQDGNALDFRGEKITVRLCFKQI
jgi:hypothetical protein